MTDVCFHVTVTIKSKTDESCRCMLIFQRNISSLTGLRSWVFGVIVTFFAAALAAFRLFSGASQSDDHLTGWSVFFHLVAGPSPLLGSNNGDDCERRPLLVPRNASTGSREAFDPVLHGCLPPDFGASLSSSEYQAANPF